jgi:AhpD family alkylhydroperoxidase
LVVFHLCARVVHCVQRRRTQEDRMTTNDVFAEIEETFGLVPQWIKQVPETGLGALWSMMRDFYIAETQIPNKYKELIGLAVAGATRCRYCALFHTEAARVHGATEAEIAEASLMGGVTMLASTFVNAEQIDYDKFKRETLDIVKYVTQKRRGEVKPRAIRASHA